MAALAHLGVGLAAKPLAPNIPVPILIVGAYAIDLVWGVFFFSGIEHLPESGLDTTNPWSHGLFMSVIWSLLAALLAGLISRNPRSSILIGLLVFSHWVVDFISHPMTAVYPGDTGLPLLFEGSQTVGLGMWSTQLGVNIGEYGTLLVGLAIYLLTLVRFRKQRSKLAHS